MTFSWFLLDFCLLCLEWQQARVGYLFSGWYVFLECCTYEHGAGAWSDCLIILCRCMSAAFFVCCVASMYAVVGLPASCHVDDVNPLVICATRCKQAKLNCSPAP